MNAGLAEFIRDRRRELSLSQAELSRRTSGRLSHTTIANLEKGADPRTGKPRHPRAITLRILAPVLETTYEHLAALAGYGGISEEKTTYGGKTTALDGRLLNAEEKAVIRALRDAKGQSR